MFPSGPILGIRGSGAGSVLLPGVLGAKARGPREAAGATGRAFPNDHWREGVQDAKKAAVRKKAPFPNPASAKFVSCMSLKKRGATGLWGKGCWLVLSKLRDWITPLFPERGVPSVVRKARATSGALGEIRVAASGT